MNAVEILDKLEASRYAPPEWAMFREVCLPSMKRRADAFALNLWESRSGELHGLEVKCWRGDWLKELRDPSKADEFFAYCDRFWLVVSDSDVCKPDEVPETWGLLVVHGSQIRADKKAPLLTPKELTRYFVRKFLRRFTESHVSMDSVEKRIQSAVLERMNQDRRRAEELEKENARLSRILEEFLQGSGIDLHANQWRPALHDPKTVGRAVRLVLDGGLRKYRNQLDKIGKEARRIADYIANGIQSIDASVPVQTRPDGVQSGDVDGSSGDGFDQEESVNQ